MAGNPEADALKARRVGTRQAAKAAEAPPLADKPVVVGEPTARRYPTLGDPREPRMVAEASGAVFGVQPGEPINGYVVSPVSVWETIVPPGCTTGTSRLRWAAGQHVPTEVYRKWEAEQERDSDADLLSDTVKALDALGRSGAAD